MKLAIWETRHYTWRMLFDAAFTESMIARTFQERWKAHCAHENSRGAHLDPELFDPDDMNIVEMVAGRLYRDYEEAPISTNRLSG